MLKMQTSVMTPAVSVEFALANVLIMALGLVLFSGHQVKLVYEVIQTGRTQPCRGKFRRK